MELKSLYVSRSWADKPVSGKIEFGNDLGTISLALDEQACSEILKSCADSLVRVSKQAAEEMSAKVIEAVTLKQIPKDPHHG